MTIKQQGGIFGRNPAFNNVEVEGNLSVDNLKLEGNTISSTNSNGNITLSPNGTGSLVSPKMTIESANPTILFQTEGGTSTDQVYIQKYSNDLYIYNKEAAGKIFFGTNNATKMTLTNSGNLAFGSGLGIDFSATSGTGTSELFDDYEEGTWTPTIIGRSSAGSGTYTTQRGMYTKVGDTVFFYAILNWSAHTGTGNMAISGLPFTTFGTIGHNPTMSVMGNNLTFSGQLSAIIDRNATTITIRTFASGGAASDLAMDTAAGIYVSGFYKAA